jgi:hypothetical protein
MYSFSAYSFKINIVILTFKGPEGVLIELPPQFTTCSSMTNLLEEFNYYGEFDVYSLSSAETRYGHLLGIMRELFYSFGITSEPTGILNEILSGDSEYHALTISA